MGILWALPIIIATHLQSVLHLFWYHFFCDLLHMLCDFLNDFFWYLLCLFYLLCLLGYLLCLLGYFHHLEAWFGVGVGTLAGYALPRWGLAWPARGRLR